MDTAFDNLKFEIHEESHAPTRIKVIGIGGAGSNAVSRIAELGPAGAEYYILNTDHRGLDASPVENKHLLGGKTTGGRGTGANPSVGRQTALDDTEHILEILEGADLVILAAGLGGGTGTGAAPVIASLAREMNALTIGVVTRPFSFEGPRKMEIAEKGLEELTQVLDNILIVPNDRLLDIAPRGTSFKDALRMVDDVLVQTVNGIGDIVLRPGIINRDFSDIKATLSGMGTVRLGSATAAGGDAVVEAARKAIECPMLDAHGISGARVVLLHVMGSANLQLHDVYDATEFIRKAANNPDLHVNLGLSIDESLGDRVQVTVIATSFDEALALADPIPVRKEATMAASASVSARPSTVPAPRGPQQTLPPNGGPAERVARASAPSSHQSVNQESAIRPVQPSAPKPNPAIVESAKVFPALEIPPLSPVWAANTSADSRTAPWAPSTSSMDDTRETPVAETLLQETELGGYTSDYTEESMAEPMSPLFNEPLTDVHHPDGADSSLFDLDDLDTPAYLRQNGNTPR